MENLRISLTVRFAMLEMSTDPERMRWADNICDGKVCRIGIKVHLRGRRRKYGMS